MSLKTVTEVDNLIIGAGPAGLQLGYFFERSRRSYLILERGNGPGAFFARFPRHRRLISINKVHTGTDDPALNLRWDWNSLLSDDPAMLFRHFSERYFPDADDMRRYLAAFAERFALAIAYGVGIESVEKQDGWFHVRSASGQEYRSKRVILATGVGKEHMPTIPGIEHAESYSEVSVDPRGFTNQRVLIIGKGNSAFETADNLIEHAALIHLASPRPLQMAWKTHFVGHLRAANNNLLDTYQLKMQNAVLDAIVEKLVERRGRVVATFAYTHAGGEREELEYDRVISCTGFALDRSLFSGSCQPELDDTGRFLRLTSRWESTNVEGLFCAGTLMQSRDYKRTMSGFIHGFRYNIRALARILDADCYDVPLAARCITVTPQTLATQILDRVNRSSSLWQQPSFIGDLWILGNGAATVYEALPVSYIHESGLAAKRPYLVVTLEYGSNHADRDPFSMERVPRTDVARAAESTFLHPVVRHYSADGKQLSEHHVIEDLDARWRETEHIEPLRVYCDALLRRAARQSVPLPDASAARRGVC